MTDVPQPATSLGGVESLAEQRVQADPKESPHLVRLSIGVEEVRVSHSGAYLFCSDLKLTPMLGSERRLAKGTRGDIERKLELTVMDVIPRNGVLLTT